MRGRTDRTDRGQTFTLEAFVAAILLLAAVAFAMQVVAVSSNTADQADIEVGAQHTGLAQGVLDQSADNGTLQSTLVYWDENGSAFHGADDLDEGFYIGRAPPTIFGNKTAEMFDDRQDRYNIDLYYTNTTENGNQTRERQRLVEMGTPSDDAVRVTQTVVLYNDTTLVDENRSATDVTLADVTDDETAAFYAPDANPDSPVYNVVRVEVVLWRT